ncbi:unnamed protein product [Chrysodeixis includens]|uniref:Uncharacterized protein n=1 Tax=Chrysodeixis includens TaxID=689277 RepID=A0A9N8Q137_CHRIL|nr:unnamed protein product [Chrysodeixis includens]
MLRRPYIIIGKKGHENDDDNDYDDDYDDDNDDDDNDDDDNDDDDNDDDDNDSVKYIPSLKSVSVQGVSLPVAGPRLSSGEGPDPHYVDLGRLLRELDLQGKEEDTFRLGYNTSESR